MAKATCEQIPSYTSWSKSTFASIETPALYQDGVDRLRDSARLNSSSNLDSLNVTAQNSTEIEMQHQSTRVEKGKLCPNMLHEQLVRNAQPLSEHHQANFKTDESARLQFGDAPMLSNEGNNFLLKQELVRPNVQKISKRDSTCYDTSIDCPCSPGISYLIEQGDLSTSLAKECMHNHTRSICECNKAGECQEVTCKKRDCSVLNHYHGNQYGLGWPNSRRIGSFPEQHNIILTTSPPQTTTTYLDSCSSKQRVPFQGPKRFHYKQGLPGRRSVVWSKDSPVQTTRKVRRVRGKHGRPLSRIDSLVISLQKTTLRRKRRRPRLQVDVGGLVEETLDRRPCIKRGKRNRRSSFLCLNHATFPTLLKEPNMYLAAQSNKENGRSTSPHLNRFPEFSQSKC